MAAAAVCGPTGAKTWIQLSDGMTAQQLQQKAVEQLPWVQGQSVDNMQLTLRGEKLEKSTPLSKCTFLSSDVFHLVLRVRGG